MVKFSSPVLCLTLWCCLTVAIVQSSEDGRPERFPLNQAGTCLEQSEITENTIIRTKDSRALGARFLNETSLGLNSRDQCLRLCCSFHGCNVAVYEEKVISHSPCLPIPSRFICSNTIPDIHFDFCTKKKKERKKEMKNRKINRIKNPSNLSSFILLFSASKCCLAYANPITKWNQLFLSVGNRGINIDCVSGSHLT